jgi:hypothetical protein
MKNDQNNWFDSQYCENKIVDDSDHYDDDLVSDENIKSKKTFSESIDDYIEEC